MKQLPKKIFILPFLLLLCLSLHSQAQSWQWLKRGGGLKTPYSHMFTSNKNMATDKHGNVYTLTVNLDTSNIDGQVINDSLCRMVLASWDCNGTFRWMKILRSTPGTGIISRHIVTDTLEGIYVSGKITALATPGTAYFDTDTATTGIEGTFIIKYNSSGAFQWFKMPQQTQTLFSNNHKMAAAADGRLYRCAYLSPGSYDNGAFSISTAGYYIVAYDASGVFQQLLPLPVTTTITANGSLANHFFTRDSHSGGFYMVGKYSPTLMGTLTIGGMPVTATGANSWPMYVAAFDSTGSLLWLSQSSSDKKCQPVSVISGTDGRLYIAGHADSYTVFNGDTLNASTVSQYGQPFIMALDSAGTPLWSTHAVSQQNSFNIISFRSIAQSNNDICLIGDYIGSVSWQGYSFYSNKTAGLFARLHAATGVIIQVDSLKGERMLGVPMSEITADNKSNFYSRGHFDSVIYYGTNSVTALNVNGWDWFIAKHGKNNCNCQLPYPDFSFMATGALSFSFTHTGTTPYTTIRWDFGDGATATGIATPTHTYAGPGNYPVCVTTVNGCDSNTACHFVSISPNAVRQLEGLSGLSVYPNPATDMLIVEKAEEGMLLDMYDLSGKRIMRTRLKNSREMIPVRHLIPGAYFLRFTDKQGRQGRVSFIKE